MGVYANLRPARAWEGLEDATPFKPQRTAGTDLIIVRELLGGLYFGEPRGIAADGQSAFNTMKYSVGEVQRVARVAFQLAQARSKRMLSVDKANVLETSQLWRKTVTAMAADYPGRRARAPVRRRVRDEPRARTRRATTSCSPRTCSATSSRTRRAP